MLNNSDEELNQYFLDYDSRKSKKEPIRLGYIRKYYGPIFVHGDACGLLETKVIAVDLNRDPIGILDN